MESDGLLGGGSENLSRVAFSLESAEVEFGASTSSHSVSVARRVLL